MKTRIDLITSIMPSITNGINCFGDSTTSE